jgi:dsDNA-binding SOS-regulon protein
MSLVPMWKCDRDNSMFESKKNADTHDKMLELAEQFTALAEYQFKNINETEAEQFGMLMAKNKELIIQACKGKPETMESIINPTSVTQLVAKA